jgi:glycosyltransferase involved in cell wall biosynthesis
MPKVSVIIPTYNRAEMVKEAISSVLAQTLSDLEVIVVDDGSADHTRQTVESLNDGRVQYFYKENGGPASARNFGLSKAKGEYITFLDSDDYWPDNYLKVMVSRLENNSKFGAAYSPVTLVYPDGSQLKSYKCPKGKQGWICIDLFENSFIWIFAAVFCSSAWQDFYFDEKLSSSSEDSDAILRLAMKVQFIFVPEVEAFHRISFDSISAQQGVNLNRVLSQQRLYFLLGGNRIIPSKIAKKRLSHSFRKVAEERKNKKARTAAIQLYSKAIKYWPFDIRLYIGLIGTMFVTKDTEPSWRMPTALGQPIGTNRFLQE